MNGVKRKNDGINTEHSSEENVNKSNAKSTNPDNANRNKSYKSKEAANATGFSQSGLKSKDSGSIDESQYNTFIDKIIKGKEYQDALNAAQKLSDETGIAEDVMNDKTKEEAFMKQEAENSVEQGSDISEPQNDDSRPLRITGIFRRPDHITPKANFVSLLAFSIGFLFYLEIVFHLLAFKTVDSRIIYPLFFTFPAGAVITILSGFFSRTVNKIIMWALTGITCLIFCVQLIYNYVFKVFFSFQSIGMAGDAFTNFGKETMNAIHENILGLVLLLLPLPVLAFVIHKTITFEGRNIKKQALLFAGAFAIHLLVLVTLLFYGKGDFSPYDLYFNSKVPELCGKQFGIITLTRFDLAKFIRQKGENDLVIADTRAVSLEAETEPTAAPTPVPQVTAIPKPAGKEAVKGPTLTPAPAAVDTSPNIMNIDFNDLAENESDKTVKTLHQYFGSVTPTKKNKYTGMFKGYNLIMITAEGFSPYAVNEAKTPTLYKLVHEGFVFNNFYTALWQTSTSDGEYVAMTGLIPVGTRSMYQTRNNLMPFVLGHQFDLLGVASKAYHNHTYSYYKRNETHPNLGYIYKGKGNGLVLDTDCWPSSDLEMINHTVSEYIGEKQFHVYYMTVSGHMNYTFYGNSMSYKNRALVEDLPYSEDCKAYIACQIELDKALEKLLYLLEKAGVADKTVIALSADHYPYGWDKKNLDELAGHTIDPDFEIYKNHFILWNSGMKENIIVDKPCCSLDILPTLSNLFGITYDSRLLMGRDIFSDSEPLVILSNRSFITDKVRYNSDTGEVTYLTNEALPEGYVKTINKIVRNKFNVSQSILDCDYYRRVFPNYPEDFK